MNRREAKFATEFSKWAKHNWPSDKPAYFEYKVSITDSLLFSAISEKQYANLQIRKFYYKFSDFDRMGTPLDAVMFCGQGYIVIQFYKKGNKEFFMITIQDFIRFKESSKRKSITLDEARSIADIIGTLA